MPADTLSREEIEKWRRTHAEMLMTGHDDDEAPNDFKRLVDAAEAHLSEPAQPDDGWIEWDDVTTIWGIGKQVEVKLLNGQVVRADHSSPEFFQSSGNPNYAIAYRFVSAPSAPAEPDGWIKWKGGDCPIAHGPIVGLRFRDGRETETLLFRTYRWRHNGDADDIIAYRIVKPASAPVAAIIHGVDMGEPAGDRTVYIATATAEHVAALEAENKRLREGLEFYADEENHRSGPGDNLGLVAEDYGRRARALLQGGPHAG